MVSAAKAFSKEPPLRPLWNFRAIVEDFQWRYVDRQKTDQVIEYCRSAPTLEKAIMRAVKARDANGKHHNHQSKVDLGARLRLGREMRKTQNLAFITQLRLKKKPDADWDDDSFDILHNVIDDIKPYGIGPVTVYDVAVRVGAYLDVEPTKVYMHAGVKQGAKALHEAYKRWRYQCPPGDPQFGPGDALRDMGHLAQAEKVPVSYFPNGLGHLKADEVEDILCTYREVFQGWHT